MKQKRKVKTLLSGKEGLKDRMFVSLLIILGGVLILVSSGIMMRTVSAEPDVQPGNKSKIGYKGVNDRVEVLENLSFIDKDLKNDLYNVYENNSNLYITSKNVIVNDTSVSNGIAISHDPAVVDNQNIAREGYSHILGGEKNKVSSENVTIIAGSENKIEGGNNNSISLGGIGNIMRAGHQKELVMLGGKGNEMGSPNGLVGIVGGKGNKVGGKASGVTILGGSDNVVPQDENVTDVILGGKNIEAQSLMNVFAFSNNGKFELKNNDQGNAFYLNVESGLGINKSTESKGVDIKGAVGFGSVDINTKCDESNYGVQGIWEIDGVGCLVGCTKKGGGKWEMLDSSDGCRDACKKENKCIIGELYIPTSVKGSCAGDFNDRKTNRCDEGGEANYKDTVFQNVLIERCSQMESKGLKDNRCVYECIENATLTEDKVNIPGRETKGYGCYSDCTLDGVTKNHGETMYGYQNKEVSCSNDTNSPTSPQTCVNHDNRAELLCVDGTWYDKTHAKWKDESKYNNSSCTLSNYDRCQVIGYDLTKSGITSSSKKYYDTNVNWNDNDRGQSDGDRGMYKLCKDWTANAPQVNGENCTSQDPNQYHYKLVGCQEGYTRFSSTKNKPDSNGDQCRKNCTYFDGSDVVDGEEKWVFRESEVDCDRSSAGGCTSVLLQCNDGVWKEKNANYSTTNIYEYAQNCSLVPACMNSALSKSVHDEIMGIDELKNLTRYNSCYGANEESCSNPSYEFEGCNDGGHVENIKYRGDETIGYSQNNDGINRYCLPNTRQGDCEKGNIQEDDEKYYDVHEVTWQWINGEWFKSKCEIKCTDSDNKVFNNDTEKCEVKAGECAGTNPVGTDGVTAGPGQYPQGASLTDWDSGYVDASEFDASVPCTWTCLNGFHREGNGCVKNPECKGIFTNASPLNQISPDATADVTSKLYETKTAAGNKQCAYVCDSDTIPSGCNSSGECQECKKEGECGKGDDPQGEGYILWLSTYSAGHTPTIWSYAKDTSNLKACEYKCNTDKRYKPKVTNGEVHGCEYEAKNCKGSVTTPKGCRYNVADLSHGVSTDVDNSESKHTGQANIKCNDGDLEVNEKFCEPISCEAKSHNYGKCSYDIPRMSEGEIKKSIPNKTDKYAGSITAECKDGDFVISDEKCEEQACGATEYTQGNCTYNVTSLPEGDSGKMENKTEGYKGTIDAKCENKELSYSNPICKKTSCDATIRKNGCEFSINELKDGQSQSDVENTAEGYKGTAQAKCVEGELKIETKCEKLEYKVVYDENGGTPKPDTQKVKYKEEVVLAAGPSKTNCEFGGWNNSWNGSIYEAGAKYVVTRDITMTATWKNCKDPECNNTLTVNPNGGKLYYDGYYTTKEKTYTEKCGTTITLPSVVKDATIDKNSSCVIKYDTNGGSTAPSDTKATITKTTKYTHNNRWTESGECGTTLGTKYTFLKDKNGASCRKNAIFDESTTSTIATITLASAPTKGNLVFGGWESSEDGKTYLASSSYTPATCPTGTITMKAKWGNDETYTCAAGKYLPKNSTTCSDCPCGYYCEGGTWSKSADDQGKEQCESGKYSEAKASSCSSCPPGQIPSSSQCSCEVKTCTNTLVVDPNGGKCELDGSTITSSKSTEKTCGGTSTIKNCEKKVTSNCDTKFRGNGGKVKNGSTKYDEMTVWTGLTTNYNFSQWETNGTCGTRNSSSKTYTYKVDSNGTTCTKKVDWNLGSYTTGTIALPDAERSGYVFSGWYTSASGGTRIGGAGSQYVPNACGTTFYAQWKLGYGCQGNEPLNATFVQGSDSDLTSNVTRKAYKDSTAASGKKCAYICNSGYEPNLNGSDCDKKAYKCEKTHYGCVGTTGENPSDSDSSKYTWNCGSTDCYECKSGYEDQGKGICLKCLEGTQVGNTCIIDLECEKNYGSNYVQVGEECKPYGSCADKDGAFSTYSNYTRSYGSFEQSEKEVLPIGKTGTWSCKSSSKDVTLNSCEFSCPTGSQCNYDNTKCIPDKYCTTDPYNFDKFSDYNTSLVRRNATKADQDYVEVSESELLAKKNSNAEGCFVACKDGFNFSGWGASCRQEYSCDNDYTIGGKKYGGSIYETNYGGVPTEDKQKWEYVTSDKFEDERKKRACIWTCDEGTPLHLNSISEFNNIFHYSFFEYYTCWKKCNSGEYFYRYWCATPGMGYEVDTDKVITYAGISNYYAQRLKECPKGSTFNANARLCLLTNKLSCDDLGDGWEKDGSTCVKCMSSAQHYDYLTKQCVDN